MPPKRSTPSKSPVVTDEKGEVLVAPKRANKKAPTTPKRESKPRQSKQTATPTPTPKKTSRKRAEVPKTKPAPKPRKQKVIKAPDTPTTSSPSSQDGEDDVKTPLPEKILGKRKQILKPAAAPPKKKARKETPAKAPGSVTPKRAPAGRFNIQKALDAGLIKVGDRFVLKGLKGTEELGDLIYCVVTSDGKLLTEEPEKQVHDNFTAWINVMLSSSGKGRGGKLKHAVHERTDKNVSQLHAELKDHDTVTHTRFSE